MAQASKTAQRAPWRVFGALEGYWGISGGPRCPLSAAHGAATTAVVANPARDRNRSVNGQPTT
eukprot:8192437-Lingulodinium_polyedra.AAC.1